MLAAKSFAGNPYDGHTLVDTVAQAERMTGIEPERIYADKGYRGHDYERDASVMLSGHKRGLSPQMKCELKRRSPIEATIGHMKADGRLDRNFLAGQAGHAINALLAGHNLRLILNALAVLLAWILYAARQSGEMAKLIHYQPWTNTKYQSLRRCSGRTK